MDRYEYKTKIDEIKDLIRQGNQEEAFAYIESINWRKVRNVNALMKAAELCETMGKLLEAKELLQLAHDRSPIGRMIIYRLALISIKMNEFDEAKEYYDEFVEIAPHDSLKYLIKYQLNKTRGADDGTLIAILEEMKNHDFLEEWAFELACLYHKTAQIDKCIDLCDEIILWFGDGVYVEKALELKMLYQPLDKQQEDKYRQLQQRKDGITEIRPEDNLDSGEILHSTITIPQVQLPPERFNTVNLQAEIKKNIDEIMKATEAGEVSENMDNIKMLVEEIPYLQVAEEPVKEAQEHLETENTINDNLKSTFQEFLAEEYDGQISLFVPEESPQETQIKGQMTIEEVMGEWEKTKRAAEAALQEAEQKKLEFAKEKALKEANIIMDRLEEAMPRLDAGVTPSELLREEYLQGKSVLEPQEPMRSLEDYAAGLAREEVEESRESKEHFAIPKVPTGIGLEIPIVHSDGIRTGKGENGFDIPAVTKSQEKKETKEWQPPTLNTSELETNVEDRKSVNMKEASKLVEDVNKMLQNEIDRLFEEIGAEPTIDEGEIPVEDLLAQEEKIEWEMENHLEGETEMEPESIPVVDTKPEEEVVEDTNPENEDDLTEEMDTEGIEPRAVDTEAVDPDEVDPVAILADSIAKEIEAEEAIAEEAQETQLDSQIQEEAEELPLPEIEEIRLDADEVADLVDENVLEKAISDELPITELTEDEKKVFSYFMPISGMERMICQVLTGAKGRLMDSNNSSRGNIIIQGGVGSGKTMMATNLVTVLQNEINKPNGNVGKIDGDKLNEKDIQKLFDKIKGGCLIIEKAGEISRETAVTLSLLMENDSSSVLVILEDTKIGIERVMALSSEFSRKFTEKITIPVFTIDELVNFGKTYARDNGYVVDEMGVLAMYNRINLIQRLDHPTSLLEVRDIMDEAIDNAEHVGLRGMFSRFGSPKTDDEGNMILREKDFEQS